MSIRKVKSRIIKMKFLGLCLFVALTNFGICAFQLSMVASRAPFGSRFDPSLVTPNKNTYAKRMQTATTTASPSITSALISQLACMALKRRLKDQTHVSCDLTTNSNGLLQGMVGPVTVKGRGWKSSRGLSCRAIEATVDKCQLDMGKVLANQKLVLTTPGALVVRRNHVSVVVFLFQLDALQTTLTLNFFVAAQGRAMVALSAEDFGNFITHPLMRAPAPPKIAGLASAENKLEFLKENVLIEPKHGSVSFYGTFAGARWKFMLQRAPYGKHVLIQASLVEEIETAKHDVDAESLAAALTKSTSNFFNEMVFELDGTYLSFNDMMLTEKGMEPSVMLSLTILVRKFPSPGLEF